MTFNVTLQKNLKLDPSKLSLSLRESRENHDRQMVFHLVRQLVQAQLELTDEELARRLRTDVADRGIDLDRVINLMYSCSLHEDDNEMTKVDEIYQRTGLVG